MRRRSLSADLGMGTFGIVWEKTLGDQVIKYRTYRPTEERHAQVKPVLYFIRAGRFLFLFGIVRIRLHEVS